MTSSATEALPNSTQSSGDTEVDLDQRRMELISEGRFEEAVAFLQDRVAAAPDHHRALLLLGIESCRLFRWEAAIDALLRALVLKPDDDTALVRLGIAFAKSGHFLSAEKIYARALSLGSNDEVLAKRFWGVVAKTKRFPEAAQFLQEVYDETGDRDLGVILALALERSGQVDAAIQVLADVLEKSPDFPDGLLALGRINLRNGDPEAAVAALAPAASQPGSSLDLQIVLADAYVATQDHLKAVDVLEGALASRPNTAILWERCAAAYAAANQPEMSDKCSRRAEDATTRVEKAMELIDGAPSVDSRWHLVDLCLEARPQDGLIVEFGVAAGTSIRYIAQRIDGRVFGFDSFEGLPGESDAWTKGQFAQATLPAVPSNVELVVGWYDKTLEPFLADHPGPVSFAHIDCDLYVSAKYVFESLADRLVPGSILLFDELWRFGGWENEEWRALEECLLQRGVSVEFIGKIRSGPQVAVRID